MNRVVRLVLTALTLSLTASQAVSGQIPEHPPLAGAPTKVLVLGTPHLSAWPEGFDRALLEPLLDRLALWQPEAIAVEGLSGPQCEMLERYSARYGTTADDYCPDRKDAFAATGLDVAAATAKADTLLAAWPAAPIPAQRRQLAAVFLAAGEPASALVQWLRLPLDERVAGDGLDAALVIRLGKIATHLNENYAVAAVLAARLGLERVFPVDDHTADLHVMNEAAFGDALRRVWTNAATERRIAQDRQLMANLGKPGGVLEIYRAHNTPAYGSEAFASDFGAALADRSAQPSGRIYAAAWETRNLRMVANIREIASARPGIRLLALVGASHKPYYERYLAAMHDLRLDNSEKVLK